MTLFGIVGSRVPPPTPTGGLGRYQNKPRRPKSHNQNEMTMLSTSSFTATPASTSTSISSTQSRRTTLSGPRSSQIYGNYTKTNLIHILNLMMSKGYLPLTRSRKWNEESGVQVINGKNIQRFLYEHGFANDENQALEIGQQLIRLSGLIPTFKVKNTNESFIISTSKEYVHKGLTNLHKKGLNCIISNPSKPRYLLDILLDFNVAFKQLCHFSLTDDGYLAVQYSEIRSSVPFREILLLLSELEFCKVGQFGNVSDHIKLSCWVNLHNFLIIHSISLFGYPHDMKERLQLFENAAYMVANERLTASHIQNIILRNKSSSFKRFQLRQFDPRVNLLLSHGAISSPSLLPMVVPPSVVAPPAGSTTVSIQSNLSEDCMNMDGRDETEKHIQNAVKQFIDTNVQVSITTKTVSLHRIFKWYWKDFIKEEADFELLSWIARHASSSQGEKLCLAIKHQYTVLYEQFDWASDGQIGSRSDVKNMRSYDEYFARTV